MTDKIRSLSYFEITKNIYYSMLFMLPMLFLYEIMCWFQFAGMATEIRNGADVFLRQLMMGCDKYSESIYGLLLIVLFFVIMFFNQNAVNNGRLKFSFLIYMLAESILWSFGFIIMMSISENLLLSILERNIIPEQFYLAIGAGIWEELLFRVGAIGFSLSFLTKVIGYSGFYSAFIAILLSALIFSLFHYLGPFGDNFAYKSFYLRTLAGIFLGSLYLFRGFGIIVYTHIFYDMTIISIPVLLTTF